MALTLITGKTWIRSFRRKKDGEPVPFVDGDTLRAQLKEKPTDDPIEVLAEIVTPEEGAFRITLSYGQTDSVPAPPQFGAIRTYWLDIDVINGDTIRQLVAGLKVFVKAGVTEGGAGNGGV